ARRLGAVAPGGYGAALLAAAVAALVRNRDAAALLMPAAVATMHLAWGCGFLVESRRGRRVQTPA
ncbi:MAG: glycosyltransferase family 2 protein, partial [Acidimicrobiia bacterium]|nr:glycosyltransferase family 2 protein [Acidimicrobiia bacterium]